MRISLLGSEETPALQAFLDSHEGATFFHVPEWHQILRETYGHRCDYWVARRAGQIVGAFPVTLVRHPLLGTKAIAMPYQFYSGLPLARDEEIQATLVSEALAAAREAGAAYLEIRHHSPADFLRRLGFVSRESGLVTTGIPLADLRWSKVRSGQRRNITFAQRQGLRIEEDTSPEALRRFRQMLRVESREMANPQAGALFFEKLSQLAPDHYRLLFAHTESACLGGLLTVTGHRTVFARYMTSLSPEARRLFVGKALCWRAMSDAAEAGQAWFDLGISWHRDLGLINAKEGWGGTTRTVYLFACPIKSTPPVPGKYFEGFTIAKAVWRRLPLAVVDRLGQMVTHWVC